MARWPEYFMVAESPAGDLMGYIMGKSEGLNENWHGHVTAVRVVLSSLMMRERQQDESNETTIKRKPAVSIFYFKIPYQVTVGPEHRRLGLANRLMEGLEEISDGKNCYFVDLFVR